MAANITTLSSSKFTMRNTVHTSKKCVWNNADSHSVDDIIYRTNNRKRQHYDVYQETEKLYNFF